MWNKNRNKCGERQMAGRDPSRPVGHTAWRGQARKLGRAQTDPLLPVANPTCGDKTWSDVGRAGSAMIAPLPTNPFWFNML